MKKFFALCCVMAATAIAWAQGPNNSGTYYQAANGKSGQALKTALAGIIKNGHTALGYNDKIYEAYKKTDNRPDGKVRDWYSNATNYKHVTDKAGTYKAEGDCYNREHSLPQSWFESYGEADIIKCDIIHVVPTDGYINNMRGNLPLANVNPNRISGQSKNNYSKWGQCGVSGYSGSVFEPNDEIKGDMARIYFYLVTRYEDQATKWAGNATASAVFTSTSSYQPFKQWYFNMLLEWAQDDPIDAVEIARNNAVYGEQKNRNPFVDYPGLEDYIWGDKKDEPFDYANYNSTVAVRTPTFSPDGGTYTSPQSVTISCKTDGATIYYTTDGTTPTASSTTYSEPITVSESLTLMAIAIKGDDQSSVAAATYTIREEGDDPTPTGDNIFKKITSTSDLESGKRYLIVYEGDDAKALTKFDGSGGNGQVTINSNVIDMNNSSNTAMILTLEKSGSYWIVSGNSSYMALTSDKNALNVASSATENTAKWSISIDSDGKSVISNAQFTNRVLQYNSSTDMFRCYTGGQQKIALYKESSSSVVTGIGSASESDSASPSAIYTLQGTKIDPKSPMKRGIYVAKGKKWMVK